MSGHHFISYSSIDAGDFALSLCNKLQAGPPEISAWLDKREIRPGQDWDTQIVEAIRTCESLIFVMTRDSVEDESVCKQEWTRALKYKKPIIPLQLHRDAEMPFRLGSRQYINFTGSFDAALAQLREHLDWLGSQEGELQTLQHRLQDAQRALRRADPEERTRILDEIEALRSQIAHQRRVLENPQEAERRVEESIERGLEREREPEEPVHGESRTKFINPPPAVVPRYFQDRHVETGLIGDFLKDDALRLMTVVGRGGIGKTAMVCRLLKSLESGRLPDDGGPLSVDGIVYLSEAGSRGASVPYLYADLSRLLPKDVAEDLDKVYRNPQASIEAKMYALLEAFPSGRYVLLLDNFENVIDPETREISDAELEGALRALLDLPQHAVKTIVTTRVAPRDLALARPERQRPLYLDEGLPSPYAENILREMDADGKVGLKSAPEELLDEARQRTRGFPRALEALFAILSADRDTSLREILDDTEGLLPENVVEVLVGEAFSRLDPAAQMVMQALAVYAHPVTPAAVDHLLLPYRRGLDSAPVLNRLVNMQFARKEAGRYYLHQLDRAYALSRVPQGEVADREETDAPPFTQFALLHRAADYFEQTRTLRENWRTIEDLAPQLAEFELRCAGQDYDTAASVLLEIDFDYLLLWGHYRLVTELHQRLQDKLGDPYLQGASLNSLGSAYYSRGWLREAVILYEQALEIDRVLENRDGEGAMLGNLGAVYGDLGQPARAIDYYEQALEIYRETGNRGNEGALLGNLGAVYDQLGQPARAIDYYEQSLHIAREVGDRVREANALLNLGEVYAGRGQTVRAKEHTEQALDISRESGNRRTESLVLGMLGTIDSSIGRMIHARAYIEQALDVAREIRNLDVEANNLIRLGDLFVKVELGSAEHQYKRAVLIADELGYQPLQCLARIGLARARLYAGDLVTSRAAVDAARRYELPRYNYDLLALVGVVALRAEDLAAAQEAFEAAVAQAEAQLNQSDQVYSALDSKGLALCGLALCEGNNNRIPAAMEAYRAARAIDKNAGTVDDVLRLFDTLKPVDPAGVLAKVRAAAAGTEIGSANRGSSE